MFLLIYLQANSLLSASLKKSLKANLKSAIAEPHKQ